MKYLAVYLVIVNLLGFILMGADKKKAWAGAWRIPERVLLLTAAAGGSAGALLGMLSWRHKIRKKKFTLGIPAILLAQLGLAAAVYFRFFRGA